MAILPPSSFDGVNLTITLLSGETEVDVFEDIYEGAKDWYRGHPDNRRFPFPFRSDGGNPLTAVINQGGYVFLNNTAGWRIKPPEEDITIYLTGNLAVEDTTLDAFVPTTGNFTAAVLGLQPVTQGVVPQMRSQLAFSTFQNTVAFDPLNRTGNAIAGTGEVGLDNIGTRRLPSNNTEDVKTIADANGLAEIALLSSFTGAAETTDFSLGYRFRGDSPELSFNANTGLLLTNCSFDNLSVTGEMDGVNAIKDCEVGNITSFSGHITMSDLDGDIQINGNIECVDCYSGRAGLGYSRITSIAANTVIVRRLNGSIGLAGMTGGDHSIGVWGGRIIIEATCSGGTIYLRGSPYDVVDLSGGAVTLVDQTESKKVTEIWRTRGLDPDNPVTIDEQGNIDATGIDIDANTTGTSPNRVTTQTRQ